MLFRVRSRWIPIAVIPSPCRAISMSHPEHLSWFNTPACPNSAASIDAVDPLESTAFKYEQHAVDTSRAAKAVSSVEKKQPITRATHRSCPFAAAHANSVRPVCVSTEYGLTPHRSSKMSNTTAWPLDAAATAASAPGFFLSTLLASWSFSNPKSAPRSNSARKVWCLPAATASSAAARTCASRIFPVPLSGAVTYTSSITVSSFETSPSFAAATNTGYALNKRSTNARASVPLASEFFTPRFQLPGVPPREDVVVVTELVSLSDDADAETRTPSGLRAAVTVETPKRTKAPRRTKTGVWEVDVDAMANDRMTQDSHAARAVPVRNTRRASARTARSRMAASSCAPRNLGCGNV
mmetsp:Transcript_10931/g.40435  ORF Transcript_10931/g.40435 Transcript_10931/m.40435 type:complete len:354 (+) Transcript_10931:1007-2068(+)